MGGAGACAPGSVRCDPLTAVPQNCASGAWQSGSACTNNTPVCLNGACVACSPNSIPTTCMGDVPQRCDFSGQWVAGSIPCEESGRLCLSGSCVSVPRSCGGLASNCGPNGDDSCCRAFAVPGGTFDQRNDPTSPQTVASFALDAYEVTAARLRAFISAGGGTQVNPPATGAGAGPELPSGWDPLWTAGLPLTATDFQNAVSCDSTFQTWAPATGSNDNRPANCLDWYEAFAFCAWDGGYLPGPFQWNYAAAGGSQQRRYPWSTPPSSTVIDWTYASYADDTGNCLGDNDPSCTINDLVYVGTKQKGGQNGDISTWPGMFSNGLPMRAFAGGLMLPHLGIAHVGSLSLSANGSWAKCRRSMRSRHSLARLASVSRRDPRPSLV